MPTEAKREAVAELRQKLEGSSALIVSEYRGLRVGELGEIRRALSRQDVSYRVVKNRLLRIAAAEAGLEGLSPLLEGPTAIAFGHGDEAATAKAVLDATRPYRIVRIKGALVGGRAIDAEGVTRLSSLPSRQVLLGQLAGAVQSPLSMLAGLLGANLRNLGYALVQVRDRKSQAGEA